MPYIPNTDEDRHAMLQAIGVESIDELFEMIPSELHLGRALNLPPAMGELELAAHMGDLAAKNTPASQAVCFLGAGSYDHFIPAVVDFVASRSEFYTSYTPYQAEASQGTLKALFEYQTLITQLTGMDVSNASLYDGAGAVAEAVLMACNVTRRHAKVVALSTVHPEYRQVLQTYLQNLETRLVTVDAPCGTASPDALDSVIDEQTSCVVVQHPNFFGCLEDVTKLAAIAHAKGAALIVVADPISLGLLKRPGDCGADIVVAEGQSLGTPMSFGGPYLGILACREKFLRRMPGRLVGETVDRRDRRCWVLTLQTREQHIRREKATSNICTNQGLMALRATVYLSAMGPHGLRSTAELCLKKARYALDQWTGEGLLERVFTAPTFKEFVVRVPGGRIDDLLSAASEGGIMAGVPLECWYPNLKDCLLVAVTEKRTKGEIDRMTAIIRSVLGVRNSAVPR